MSLFFALTVGTMAFGHLLAVSVKLALGTLEGSATKLYLIGLALAMPSWWLVVHTRRLLASALPEARQTTALRLHAWMDGRLMAVVPLTNVLQQAGQQQDAHGIRVRERK